MEPIFLDTAGLVALINDDDALHARALAVLTRLNEQRTPAVTSDWVLTELLSVASRRRLRGAAQLLVAEMLENAAVRTLPASRAAWRAAFDLYRDRPDKEWSLVDCASILACKARSIRRVFTADRHFPQAGLMPLLG